MAEKVATYCTGNFLEAIYRRLNKPLSEFLLNDHDELWIAELYKFIHGNCELITDLDSTEIIRRSIDKDAHDFNPNFKKLWKNGKVNFISDPDRFIKMENNEDFFRNKTNELFLLNSPKGFCDEIGKKFGLVCSCPEMMDLNIPQLFIFEIKSLTKRGKIHSWDFLRGFRYPSNSAIIADNYLLQSKELMKDNILQILNQILPPVLNESFDLTIFTREVNNLDFMHQFIYDNCLKNFPYKINFSIGKVDIGSNGIHDRDIITNYCWYHSGAGFTLFKKQQDGVRILNDTKLFIYPLTHMGHYSNSIEIENEGASPIQASYFTALRSFRKIWKELPDKIGLYKTFVGVRKNRLLD